MSTQRIQRNGEQLRREHAERDQQRRLAELRASLPAATLEALRRRAEEALATDGTDRTHLGYEVLVKLKVDNLLEREYLPAGGNVTPGEPDAVAVEP